MQRLRAINRSGHATDTLASRKLNILQQHKLYILFISCIRKEETAMLKFIINLLTRRHKLHAPEHVGMFAGSLLPRSTWDHS